MLAAEIHAVGGECARSSGNESATAIWPIALPYVNLHNVAWALAFRIATAPHAFCTTPPA